MLRPKSQNHPPHRTNQAGGDLQAPSCRRLKLEYIQCGRAPSSLRAPARLRSKLSTAQCRRPQALSRMAMGEARGLYLVWPQKTPADTALPARRATSVCRGTCTLCRRAWSREGEDQRSLGFHHRAWNWKRARRVWRKRGEDGREEKTLGERNKNLESLTNSTHTSYQSRGL